MHIHRGVDYTGVLERAGHGCPNPFGGGSGSEAGEEHAKPGRLLDDLPPGIGGLVENVVEHDRMDIHLSRLPWQLQDVFVAPFDALQNREGPPAGAAPSAQPHGVGHFVTDQRKGAGEQDRDEELRPGRPRRHRVSGLVHGFNDEQVFVDVAVPVGAGGGDPCRFGGGVDIEGALPQAASSSEAVCGLSTSEADITP